MMSQLTEEEEKAKNLGKTKNKQEVMMVDLEGRCPLTYKVSLVIGSESRHFNTIGLLPFSPQSV